MSYKIINRVDPILYLVLSIVGFIVPEPIYKLFLLNPDAVLSSTEATIVRANGVGITFAALLTFLLGGDEENAKQINSVRYVGGLLLIGFAVFTNFNGFLIFGVTEIALALYTGRQLRPSSSGESYTPNVED
jgi:hypothetical protein|tara:strand:+ start:257 stop:652 length:396 start_codon:yes stop_codon:yes gene_type:complete